MPAAKRSKKWLSIEEARRVVASGEAKRQKETMEAFQRGVYVAIAILLFLTILYTAYVWTQRNNEPVNTKAQREVEQSKVQMRETPQVSENATGIVADGLDGASSTVLRFLPLITTLMVLGFGIGIFLQIVRLFQ